jgi:2-iminobutanoate/2-iminopropanoate deaminase
MLEKQVVQCAVPEMGGPINTAVTFGQMIFISGLPPFDEEFCAKMRDARAKGEPLPAYVAPSFEKECRIVMDNIKIAMEAAGSNMDCLLKVTVWLKDQTQQDVFDKVYRSYFSSFDKLPARTRMQAGRTPRDCGLEVDCIGYIPGKQDTAP